MAQKRIQPSGEEAGLDRDRFNEESGYRIRDYRGGLGDSLPDDAQENYNRAFQVIIHRGDRYYTTVAVGDMGTGWSAAARMLSNYGIELEDEDIDEITIRVFDDLSET